MTRKHSCWHKSRSRTAREYTVSKSRQRLPQEGQMPHFLRLFSWTRISPSFLRTEGLYPLKGNSVFNNELRVSMLAQKLAETLKCYPKTGEEAIKIWLKELSNN